MFFTFNTANHSLCFSGSNTKRSGDIHRQQVLPNISSLQNFATYFLVLLGIIVSIINRVLQSFAVMPVF